jgi:hypothetical protein
MQIYSAELIREEVVTSRKDFTMQYCFVEKQKRIIFLFEHFNSSLVLGDTVFFTNKNKVNFSHLS